MAQRAGAESQPRRNRAGQEGERTKERRPRQYRGKGTDLAEFRKKREKTGPRADIHGGQSRLFTCSTYRSKSHSSGGARVCWPSTGPLSAHPVSAPPPLVGGKKVWVVRSHSRDVPCTYFPVGVGVRGIFLLVFKLLRGDGLEICCRLGGRNAGDACVSIGCPLKEAVVGHDIRLSGWVQSDPMGPVAYGVDYN